MYSLTLTYDLIIRLICKIWFNHRMQVSFYGTLIWDWISLNLWIGSLVSLYSLGQFSPFELEYGIGLGSRSIYFNIFRACEERVVRVPHRLSSVS